ncbi:uncharacterized protein LOC119136905 isoform X2 [Syngnathus acus]|uniref:uncharacterized protein LOC119136905 isoform X2 n=1 Tax=Syngnathus acus TaxID=161584 RepID=UPI001885DFDD|nr:uncharacterized protein LOC119136905 isoform X2 [Syngnathus acus]
MEGKQEDLDDVQEERKTTLLWEKCIQQRIMVDLSEDESLHLSDLQASCLALSQAKSAVSETSIHFSDSILVRSDTVKSNVDLRNQEHEDSGQNTSDEDQEELPYDGDHSKRLDFVGPHVEEEEEDVTDKQDEEVVPPCAGPPVDINQLLLRHFSQEELLQSGRLIEAETLPEVSLLESLDDLLGSKSTRNDTVVSASISEEPSVRSFYSDGNSPSKREREEEDKTASSPDESVAAPAKCEESQVHMRKVSHSRSRSFGELKYGQGQVHYPLPDFSKVAPKVKIPKAPSGPVRLVPQVPSPMVRAQSEPGMLEVISRVLEDSGLQPSEMPQVLKDTQDQTGPDLVHHFQDEYDKLLAKYGRAENLFLELSSDICNEGNPRDGSHVGSEAPHILPLENNVEKVKSGHRNEMKPNTSDQDGGSEAEKMTAELRAVLSHFMQTVDEFKQSVTNMSVSTEEQQMILRSLMEAQDQLERKYMSKKEEHRALEMKNDLGLCRNIGTFDPNRLVEGDIFRAGMHLEDIKEMIDKNTCERSISPLLWSTPTTNKLPVKATPPPAQHQGSSVSLTATTKSEAQLEDESSKNDGLEERSELICNDSMQVNRFSVSVEGPLDSEDEENREEEEGRASGGINGKSGSAQGGVPNQECDVGEGVRLPVEVHSASNAHACRETDSGFGSSYLNQSGGMLHLNHSSIESPQAFPGMPSDGLCTSDSEGSSHNLLTTIHPKDLSSRRQKSAFQAQPEGSAAAVERWVQDTIKTSSLKLQDPDENHLHASEPNLMGAGQRERNLCTCHSEAILALQVEVSKLKKDLEEGLVQLPHLARKMDYLASKYRHDRQEHRSETKGRTNYKIASLWKSSSSRQSLSNFNSRQLKLEDWISTEMEPRKRKEGVIIRERRFLLTPEQRPLLQVSYGSSCSLPASYKLKEPHATNQRKRSTQSDSALLPSDVYFQHTPSPAFQKPGCRIGSKEEEMNRTLDQAIEAARSMKRTTDRMAKRLTADLAKAQLLPQQHSATRVQETFAQKQHKITRDSF